jgi:hypothetical protein
MAAPQGNQGGGMFARYQGEQVNQIPAGYVEGMGSMGKAYAQIGDQLGKAFVGMAQEGVKKENLQSTAQGLLDSYTNGDPESAMYSDSTPTHVKQFLGRSFESGGVGSMSTKDLNSFVAGEQAYNGKIDREIKLRQIAATEAGVDAKGGTATERLTKSLAAGEGINKAISPGLRGGAAANVPPSAAFYSDNQKKELEAAGKAATEPLQKGVDAYKSAYDQSRANLGVSEQTFVESDPTDPEYADVTAAINYNESKQKASIALQTFEEAQKKQKKAGTDAQIQSLNASFSDPTRYSQAVSQRQDAILKAIGAGKEVVRKAVAQTYGPETAMAINITKEDEEFAEKAARDIPDGTVLTQGPGYAWVMSGGKFVFKTATQMGTAESVMVLPPNLDYSKMYGGVTLQEFNGLPSNVQSKILDNVGKYASALNSQLQATMNQGEIAGNSLTADKFFGWSGYINNQTQLRHVINMTSGKKTMDWSIDQIIATCAKTDAGSTWKPMLVYGSNDAGSTVYNMSQIVADPIGIVNNTGSIRSDVLGDGFMQAYYFIRNGQAIKESRISINNRPLNYGYISPKEIFIDTMKSLGYNQIDLGTNGINACIFSLAHFCKYYFAHIEDLTIQDNKEFWISGLNSLGSTLTISWDATFNGSSNSQTTVPILYARLSKVLQVKPGRNISVV